MKVNHQEQKAAVMEQIKAIDQYLRETPYGDPMDDTYKRLVYVRYADDFSNWRDWEQGRRTASKSRRRDVLFQEQLHFGVCRKKRRLSRTETTSRTSSASTSPPARSRTAHATKGGYTKRSYTGRVKLYVPKEKWVKRLLAYGALKIHYDKANGNKEIWEPVRRPGLFTAG